MDKIRKIGWWSAAALVLANMIGTGVFTSLGFQLLSTTNTWSIILLWSIGGLVALAGAFSYAELGASLPKSGGEYYFLSKLYHPMIGYLSGWVSLTIGFSAPVALAAMAMGAYVNDLTHISPSIVAFLVVLVVSLVHSFSIKNSSVFQNIVTVVKVVLIMGFIITGLWMTTEVSGALDYGSAWKSEVTSPGFAISLVYVTYSYTGWNAAAYIVEEIKQPEKNLPRALINATLLVTVFYILLQLVFLKNASLGDLTGQLEVGQIAAVNMFGQVGGEIVSTAIALLLLSSISAMIWVGPRVTMAMAEDYKLWRALAKKNKKKVPVRAIWFQSTISILMILTGTFEQVLLYCGFILQLFSALAVAGTFLLRIKQYDLPFRNPFHPLLPILFLLVSIWILVFLMVQQPVESSIGISIIVIGLLTYLFSKN